MNLICPFCSAQFRASVTEPVAQAVRMVCPACQRQMILRPMARPAAPQPVRPAPQRRAVIADDPRPFRDFLQQQLGKLGFEVQVFDTGDAALEFVRSHGADLVIANVHLKGKMGVEVAEEIKNDPKLRETRVALTGPLFRANRFRNDPATLYGADEYIEEQIPARELKSRIGGMFDHDQGAPKEDQAAQRLARLILSDIVIRHPDRVEEGLRSGTFFEVLKKEIEDGRTYYESHVPMRVRQNSEYFNETLQGFVQMKREEL